MALIGIGDKVKIVSRMQTSEDMKHNRYFNFFADLIGTVTKVYDFEAAVKVDLQTLPDDVVVRFLASESRYRETWLSKISEDAKSKLTPEEMEFELDYTLLVSLNDLSVLEKGNGKLPIKTQRILPENLQNVNIPNLSKALVEVADAPEEPLEEEQPSMDELFEPATRLTEDELNRLEEEHLRQHKQN